MNIIKYFLSLIGFTAAMLLAALVSSCKDSNDEPTPPQPQPAGEVSRTVLVYMLAANNGLGASKPYDYDMQDIREMCAAAGDLNGGRLIVFHSATNGKQILKEINSRGGVDTLKIYDNSTVGQSAARMSEVLDDMAELAPARDYGMIFWGHGSGWLEDGIMETESPAIETYSYGGELGTQWRWMNITTLAEVLAGRGLSFIHFDCCYMASVEVLYQLRAVADRIVAYSTEILAWGMPYDRTVKYYFQEEPDLNAVAETIFDFYLHIDDNVSMAELGGRPDRYRMCTVSVLNTSAAQRLAEATRAIYSHNTTGTPDGYSPQPFTTSRPYYYCDFASYVNALDADPSLMAEFDAAMDDVVELELATEQIWGQLDIREHSGLSTFIMNSDADAFKKNYHRLDWFNDVASQLIK